MPELPDVEVFRQYIESTALRQTIESVEVRDPGMLNNVSEDRLVRELKGRKFTHARRWGKFLFLQLDNGNGLVLHYGMSGEPKYFKNPEDDPEHDRMLIHFENGYHLAYDCTRKFGEINFTEELETFVNERELGPDLLAESFDRRTFKRRLEGSRATIKSALMDQRRMAGIGNVYADETLFQAQLHPEKRVDRLSEKTLDRVYDAMQKVIRTAIDHRAKREDYPASYLVRDRGEGRPCPRCKTPIAHTEVSGRTTYYCPKCQPEN